MSFSLLKETETKNKNKILLFKIITISWSDYTRNKSKTKHVKLGE